MSNTIDQQFVEYIVKSLVSKPDQVKVERRIDEKGVLLELTVDPEDLGRVIGKRGATAQSIRTLLRALGTKQDARYNLKIVDVGEGYERAPSSSYDSSSSSSNSADESGDDYSDDSTAAPEPVEETVPEASDEDEESSEEFKRSSDKVSETRKELADLDDLDV